MTKARDLSAFPNTGFAFKNRIINGGMVINQRGSAISATDYFVDRWLAGATTSGAWTAQQTTGAPTGFTNSIAFTKTTGNAPASGDYNYFIQNIEGFNIADLNWGTANAKTVTLSFWVYSGATGTFGGSLRNGGTGGFRAYPFTYTISAANTWEYKTVTIAGDTTGTWATNNSIGVGVFFDMGSGSTARGTAGSWQAGNLIGVTGTSTYPTSTSGGSISLTGVQLEVGSTATSFDYRPYGTELALCQRYYQQVGRSTASSALFSSYGANTNAVSWQFKVPMRATPTIGGTYTGTFFGTHTEDFVSAYSLGTVYASFGYNGSAYGTATASAEL